MTSGPARQRLRGRASGENTGLDAHTQKHPREKGSTKARVEKLTKGKFFVCTVANARHDTPMRALLPKSVAQLTGVLVTGIVAFGTDIDVYYAVPLGVFAGALAILFVSMSEAKEALLAKVRRL